MRRKSLGFSLLELMTAVAIMAVLVGLAAYGLTDASRRARLSGAKFTLINTVQFAKQRAMSQGRDVYVIFSNLDSRESWPREDTARMIVYDDQDATLRGAGALDDIMANVDAANIREDHSAAGASFGSSGMAFVGAVDGAIAGCDDAQLPPYLTVTRRTSDSCDAFCSFCEVQDGQCIGAIRFSSNGKARIVTGAAGTGGLIKLVNPSDKDRTACVAIAEPAGLATVVEE